MNIILWIIAALLAAAFLFSGLFKLALSHEKYVAAQDWAEDAPRWAPHAIGALEVVGAIGVVLPAMVDIAPTLVPLAATGLALVMACAVAMHLRRREFPALAPSGVLLILAAAVAWGRFGPYAF
ncbi:DoxX family protein [Streptomyces sp. BH-SS-21]|uniref:DoxX family protein n=1 Tax=Streptomyces liliiviolaceus TaxID=2823109 RepID=A0A940Y0Y2_9ACTN|nr:DoxX family protein [Streptomyces liliiviolaceus]MBQ0854552.1 DoxX family protein [Streptomyces liliiviolaceus]